MATKGVFGYIIGKKKRMMKVSDDADLLWQIGTREIYLLMNKYKTKEHKLSQLMDEIHRYTGNLSSKFLSPIV